MQATGIASDYQMQSWNLEIATLVTGARNHMGYRNYECISRRKFMNIIVPLLYSFEFIMTRIYSELWFFSAKSFPIGLTNHTFDPDPQ